MCGLSGILFSGASAFKNDSNCKELFLNAAHKIVHRGSEPLKYNFLENVFVAHSRLAFQDLSPLSSQPIWSVDKEWVLIFNGEIYNYVSLRNKIIKEFSYPFQSEGDSEVILAGFLCYKEKILELLEGEFSFVIFKADGTEVFAGRDTYGVKPLFVWSEFLQTKRFSIAQKQYVFESTALGFASEIKGLATQKQWNKEGFLRQAVGLYEPIRTPFENIIQVPPGSYLWAKKDFAAEAFKVFLNLNATSIRSSSYNTEQTTEKIYEEFYETMLESTKERLVSDVELGVYLSGGIDSKFISALYSKIRPHKSIKSFTVGFDVEEGFDEAADAVHFSKALGFDPHICRVNYDDLNYAYPIAVYHSENIQPYTNGAAKWWLSRFARKHVQGVLTGDGADEVLCGYPSFRYAAWWKSIFKNRSGVNIFDQIKKHPLGSNWRDFVYEKRFSQHQKNPWLSGSSHAGSGLDFVESLEYWGVAHPLFGQIKSTATILIGAEEASKWLLAQRESVSSWFKFGFSEQEDFYTDPNNTLLLWQNYFCKTHLPVQVLNWVGDRMEMANTLEGRPPFMSQKLKKFIYHLNDNFFVRGFEEKSILKRSYKKCLPEYAKYLPKEKKQFNAPFLFSKQSDISQDEIFKILEKNSLMNTTHLADTLHSQSADPYIQNYKDATAQTLLSFYYVNEFICKNKMPNRDIEYESKVLLK